MEKIKIIVPFRSYPMRNWKFQKNKKKLKNTIMKSFQAKVGWKRNGKRENKKLSFRFVPTRCVIENSKKITKKFKKLKNYHYEFISRQNRLEKDEKDRNKNFSSVSFLPIA